MSRRAAAFLALARALAVARGVTPSGDAFWVDGFWATGFWADDFWVES